MNHGSTSRNSEVPSKRVRRAYKEVIGIYARWIYMGGCQNYGPFLGPYYNTAPNI